MLKDVSNNSRYFDQHFSSQGSSLYLRATITQHYYSGVSQHKNGIDKGLVIANARDLRP